MKPPSNLPDRTSSRSEAFKGATTATVKAVSGHPDTTVVYTAAPANPKPGADPMGDTRLPMPPLKLTQETVVRLRGAADALASRIRHHDAGVHARRLPQGRDALDA